MLVDYGTEHTSCREPLLAATGTNILLNGKSYYYSSATLTDRKLFPIFLITQEEGYKLPFKLWSTASCHNPPKKSQYWLYWPLPYLNSCKFRIKSSFPIPFSRKYETKNTFKK